MTGDREREIHRRVNDRYLAVHGGRWAYQQDAAFHANVESTRSLLAAMDQALEAEGIGPERRDRIVYRLLYGHAPAEWEPDWRQAAAQHVDHELAVMRLMNTDLPRVLPDLLGEVSGQG